MRKPKFSDGQLVGLLKDAARGRLVLDCLAQAPRTAREIMFWKLRGIMAGHACTDLSPKLYGDRPRSASVDCRREVSSKVFRRRFFNRRVCFRIVYSAEGG